MIAVSRETVAKLEAYESILRRWNTRINLVSPRDLVELRSRHIEDCLQLLTLLPPGHGVAADLGSGGGLPGMVLALAEPGRVWNLVEADRRKAAFLQAAAAEIGASNVVVHAARIEAAPLPKLALLTARALASLPDLLRHADRLLSPDGVAVFPKGRQAESELTAASPAWSMRVERFPSVTDPEATILRLTGICRRDGF